MIVMASPVLVPSPPPRSSSTPPSPRRRPRAPSPLLRPPATPRRLLLLPLLLCLAGAPWVEPYDCIDPENRPTTYKVKKGELTTVCLYVGPGGDWNGEGVDYRRYSVNLVADEFSSYEVPGSFNGMARPEDPFNSNATHIFAASQSSLSFLRRYYDATSNRIFPYLTAIIDVKDGDVLGIAWDDACVFCPRSECLANTYNLDGSQATSEQVRQPADGCYLTYEKCAGFAMDGSDTCNLRLHVVWTGTDVDGRVLLSSDSRFSMFPPNRIQENVQGQYDKMVENLNNMKDSVTNKIPGLGGSSKEEGEGGSEQG